MSVSSELQQAIEAARAGRREQARDLLLKLVEVDSKNEAAWFWLSGLMDSLDDQIVACENALAINPANEKVRSHLMKLRTKREENEAAELLRQAKVHAKNGDIAGALQFAQQAAQKRDEFEEAWLFIADLAVSADQRIAALEKAYALQPTHAQTKSLLEQARQLRDEPLKAAAHFEQTGKLDEALKIYNEVAARTRDSREFDRIYGHIVRIERLQKEKIRYVAPQASILRLTFGWPLLYFFLLLIQVGLHPLAPPAILLWLGLPLVILGSFLLAISEARSRHVFWQALFSEPGEPSNLARLVTAAAGWLLILFPHLFLLVDSLHRLRAFHIPPEPF